MFWRRKPKPETLWLVKDDPEGQWWCKCPQGLADPTRHREDVYPTGGTGWLFVCAKCDYAFMFARARRIRLSLEDIAQRCAPRTRDVLISGEGTRTETVLAGPADWLEVALPIHAELIEDQRYVFMDGKVLPAVHGPVKFRGLWRQHDLRDLPHLGEDSPGVLADPEYWTAEMEG